MTIQYDGSAFYGWQLQARERTVQGVIEKAIQSICKVEIRIPIHGAGRTDTGVHAFGQVAHVELPKHWDCDDLKNALNGNLPLDCRIRNVEKVDDGFQSRFDATKRNYIYQCYIGESILYENQSWKIKKVDLELLNSLANELVGDHDFLSFSKYREDIKHTRCIIHKSQWNSDGKMVIFTIIGNRFLHHMVRYLVGTMIAVAEGRFSTNDFNQLIKNPQKNVRLFKAPPEGLILEKVDYD